MVRSFLLDHIAQSIRPDFSSDRDLFLLSIELAHAASLVADDLPFMDHADTRRGKPSVHALFGKDKAMLCCYHLFCSAFELLSSARVMEKESIIRAVSCLAKVGKELVGGQWMDLCRGREGTLKKEDIEIWLSKKTGSLFGTAFVLGWLLGGGDEGLLEKVEEMGVRFGVLFQIRDDFYDREEDIGNNVYAYLSEREIFEKREHHQAVLSRWAQHSLIPQEPFEMFL